MTLTVGSLFSGIEGIGLGLKRSGMRVVWQSEIDPAACRVLAHHWPEVPNLGDITRIRLEGRRRDARIPEPLSRAQRSDQGDRHERSKAPDPVDVVCGGSPCQNISRAGNREGLEGEQSRLFFDFVRVVDAVQPRYVVLENVEALVSSNDGRDMATVLGHLWDCGFHDLAWRVVDSRGFGVPQRRYRVFVVGRAGTGTRVRDLLLEPEGMPWRPPTRRETRTDVAALTSSGVGTCGADDNQGQAGHLIPTHASTLTASAGHHGHSSPRGDGTDNIVPPRHVPHHCDTLTAAWGGNAGAPAYGARDTSLMAYGARVRRMTPVECERLQGFPDGWTEPAGSDSARYRCLGNAVTVPVAEWLGDVIQRLEAQSEPGGTR